MCVKKVLAVRHPTYLLQVVLEDGTLGFGEWGYLARLDQFVRVQVYQVDVVW